jgi:cell wall-associated NlpC family hydrolase
MTKTEKITQLIEIAENKLGTPYTYGAAAGETETFDCSSFVQYLFKQIGIDLPRSAILQAGQGSGLELDPTKLESFQAGDLVFMRSDRGHYNDEFFGGRPIDIGHVALITGPDEIIHAKGGRGVIKQPLSELTSDPHYKIVFAKRPLAEI